MIRTAAEADFQQMLSLYRDLAPPDEDESDETYLRSCWRDLVSRPGVSVIVYSHDGQLVATCTLIVLPNIMRAGRPYAYVENVVTHRDYRRRGFARATLNRAVELALDQDCYKILLVASSVNAPAAALYQSAGFSPDRTGFLIRNH